MDGVLVPVVAVVFVEIGVVFVVVDVVMLGGKWFEHPLELLYLYPLSLLLPLLYLSGHLMFQATTC